ncbi:putative SERF-like protein isoform X3 [Anopheles merus]|uniref:putative SERF-like protein isoform X3 n=1 Tax=Anopheles merus TaxID=30066 RepID=UPI001BE4D3A3|nr:putative SERF-like protein isoform X3 [Anopheles merus]
MLLCEKVESGNQRELARAKNQKKNAGQPKQRDDGLTHEQRKQRDADIMRQKQLKKEQDAKHAIKS